MDTEYLKSTIGDVLAKGCAATAVADPPDPVEYLSMWLLKHVENSEIRDRFFREKQQILAKEAERKEERDRNVAACQEEQRARAEAINRLRDFKDDVYLLWDACLQTLTEFTGCSSAYIALVLDRPWEPPTQKNEDEQAEDEPVKPEEQDESEEEEEKEEEEEEEKEENEAAANSEESVKQEENGGGVATENGETLEEEETPVKKKTRQPKPRYKKKILLYVAATENNKFMIGKQLTREMGVVTYRVMLEGLPSLLVPNVLYQKGIHFFGGLPSIGAYYVAPVTMRTVHMQFIALLCADTLKRETYGTGRSFTESEQHFILAVSDAISDMLAQNQKESIEGCSNEQLILDMQSRLKKIEEERKAALQSLSKDSTEEEGEETDKDVKQDQGIGNVEELEEEEIGGGDLYGQVGEEEEEENAEEGSEENNDDSEINMPKNDREKKKKKLMKLEEKLQNCLSVVEMRGLKTSRLQQQLQKKSSAFHDSQARICAVMEMLEQVKEKELRRIRCWLFPPTVIYRILKALLHLLGYGQPIIDDWMQMRKIIQDSFYTELKAYDVEQHEDLTKWNYCGICLEGITDEMLSAESPIGYLGKQWIVQVKEAISASIVVKNQKSRYEVAVKALADAEKAKLLIEEELKVVADEVSKLTDAIEELSHPANNEAVPKVNEPEVEEEIRDD